MAYVLGFIATDGNLFKKGGSERLAIAVQKEDCWLLKKIISILKVDNPVIRITQNKYCSITITQSGLVETFSKWNITERKSLTLQFPDKMPKKLVSHFIRGVFDGDGTITFKYNRKSQTFMQSVRIVSASQDFVNSLSNILTKARIPNSIRSENRESSGRSTLYSV